MSPRKTIRVVVADDEPLARQRILDLLASEGDVEVADVAVDGDDAIRKIRSLSPDLVFLDIQMPGKTGIDVVREIGPDRMPLTIFVTAYDQFALKAFDSAAIDYLVKPFDDGRFAEALGRARKMVELAEVGKLSERLRELLNSGEAPPGSGARSQPKYLERIAVEMKGQVRVVPVRQIDYILSSGPYAELFVGDKSYIIRETMQSLEERLDPSRFLRIHRSAIVRIELIETLLRAAGGDYGVKLKNGVRLKVSRSRYEELAARMGLT